MIHSVSGGDIRRSFLRLSVIVLLVMGAAVTVAPARAEKPSDQLMMRYLDVTNMRETIYSQIESGGNQIAASVIREMRKRKDIPQDEARKFASFLGNKFKENKEFFYNNAIAAVLPVIWKYYDREEIEALIAFYETPMGSRIAEKMPLVAAEIPITLQRGMLPLMIGRVKDWMREYKEMRQKKREEGKS